MLLRLFIWLSKLVFIGLIVLSISVCSTLSLIEDSIGVSLSFNALIFVLLSPLRESILLSRVEDAVCIFLSISVVGE